MNQQSLDKSKSNPSSQDSSYISTHQQTQHRDQQLISQYTQLYNKFINRNQRTQELTPDSRYIQYPITHSEKIIYLSKFNSQLTINVLKANDQSSSFQVSWGHICMEINILRMKFLSSNVHNTNDFIGKGSHSQVFQLQFQGQQYALKSINIDRTCYKENFCQFSQIKFIIQEYFLTRLASFLGAGPKIYNIFGYDLIIYNDRADFVLQYCQQISFDKAELLKIQHDLKNNLKRMHDFNFCHCDIKPQNMMWSPSNKRYVFIDFGISRILKQNIGYKTLTMFVGTYLYCGTEMKKTYWLKTKKYIDMYYNDVQSLQKAIQFSVSGTKRKRQKNSQKSVVKYQAQNFIIKPERNPGVLANFYSIKFYLFNEKVNQALDFMSQQKCLLASVSKLFVEQISQGKWYLFCYQIKEKFEYELILQQLKTKFQKPLQNYNEIDQFLLKYLATRYMKDSIANSSYIQFEKHLAKGKNYLNYLWDKRIGLEKILQFLNFFEDPFDQKESQIKQAGRMKFIKSYYNERKNQLSLEQKFINKEVSYQYQAYVVMREIFKFIKQTKNKKFAMDIRQIFVGFGDYIGCLQAQKYILKLLQEESTCWYFLEIIAFHLQRRQWFSNMVYFPDYERLEEVKSKKIDEQNEIECYLKEIATIVISTNCFLPEKIAKCVRGNELISRIFIDNLALPEMQKRLQQVRAYFNQLLKLEEDKQSLKFVIKGFLQLYIENLISEYDDKILMGGYCYLFCHLSKFEYQEDLYYEYLSMKEENKQMFIWELEFLLTLDSMLFQNYWLKIRLFQKYMEIFQFFQPCGTQIKECLRVFMNCMNIIILLNEKSDKQQLKVVLNFNEDLKARIITFYEKIISTQHKAGCKIPIQYKIISQSMIVYVKQGLASYIQIYINKLVSQYQFQHEPPAYFCSELEQYMSGLQQRIDISFSKSMIFLQDLKNFYLTYNYNSEKLQSLLISMIQSLLKKPKVELRIKQIPQLVQIMVKILVKRKINAQIIFEKLIEFINAFPLTFLDEGILFAFQNQFTITLKMICQNSTIQNLRNFITKFCKKLTLNDVLRNHFLCYLIFQIFYYSSRELLIFEDEGMILRKRLLSLCLVGLTKFKEKCIKEGYLSFIFWQYKIIYPHRTLRKDIILLRKETKIQQKQITSLINVINKKLKILSQNPIGRQVNNFVRLKLAKLIIKQQQFQ